MLGVLQPPYEIVADPQVQIFVRTFRIDLAAPDVETFNQGQYVVCRMQTPSGKINVVRNISPFAEYRTDIGTPNESFSAISPQDGDGFFSFSPLVNEQPTIVTEIDMNAPRTAGGTLNNRDRQKRSGFTHLSPYPLADAMRLNKLFSIPVPSEAEFEVVFEILPAATGSAIPNPYGIAPAGNLKRVDFAGVVVVGATMPQTLYDRILQVNQNQEG